MTHICEVKTLLKIGDFSKLSRISIRMLRYYNEIGLLVPENVDDFTGYRYYGEAQLPIAHRISALKDMGFSLAVIGEIITQYSTPERLKVYLEIKKTEVTEQINSLDKQLLLLETTLNRLEKGDNNMEYNIILKKMPERYVASVRKIIPSYDQEGVLWNLLKSETAQLNLKVGEPCYSLAVFHDEGFKESEVDVEIQIDVKGEYQNTENVVFKSIPEVEIASATYRGGYDKLYEVNKAVANWVRDNNYEFNGAGFSIYHVSPAQTQNPEEYVTEVCYPVRKK